MKIKVFVSNLAKYNAGQLNGQWTTLPVDNVNTDILDKLELGGNSKDGYRDEWFVSDYEAPFKISEYADLYQLNDLAQSLLDNDLDTIEDVYDYLDDKENTACEEVYPLDDDFFNEMFASPADAAKSVFFGNIKNWMDDYVYFNGYGNVESMNEYEYQKMLEENADGIIDEYKEEYL